MSRPRAAPRPPPVVRSLHLPEDRIGLANGSATPDTPSDTSTDVLAHLAGSPADLLAAGWTDAPVPRRPPPAPSPPRGAGTCSAAALHRATPRTHQRARVPVAAPGRPRAGVPPAPRPCGDALRGAPLPPCPRGWARGGCGVWCGGWVEPNQPEHNWVPNRGEDAGAVEGADYEMIPGVI